LAIKQLLHGIYFTLQDDIARGSVIDENDRLHPSDYSITIPDTPPSWAAIDAESHMLLVEC